MFSMFFDVFLKTRKRTPFGQTQGAVPTRECVKMTVTIVTIVTNAVTNILWLSGRHRGLPLHVYVKIDLFGD